MPNSYTYFKNEVKRWFEASVPTSKRILDVGPGVGTYSMLLRDSGYRMDAVEVWEPYVKQYALRDKYDVVYIANILDFNIDDYHFIILGDILEHLSEQDGVKLIKKIVDAGKQCLVAIPYMMAQDGEEYGNVYETHLQPDLTPEVMSSRYPDLKCIFSNQWYGYYVSVDKRAERAFVMYSTASYLPTVEGCIRSIRRYTDLPIILYLVNAQPVDIEGVRVVSWSCSVDLDNKPPSPYIDRQDTNIYKLLIQRPAIVKDALEKYALTVTYVDADSVASPYVETIFNMFPDDSAHPHFVEGVYTHLFIDGKGDLETPACELFNVDQSVRNLYRQTGYFVAGQRCIHFLDEWWWMCNHPKVLQNPQWYAPYHEETIANVLLWKYNIQKGLPYIYVNAPLEKLQVVFDVGFTGKNNYLSAWFKIPATQNRLLFFHGEKKPEAMDRMAEIIAERTRKRMRILFLAPHLSTGGMPSFLLKRIEAIRDSVDVYVVEYANHSPHYIVQKERIKKLVQYFWTLEENKHELIDIIQNHSIDIVHIDDMSESFDHGLMMKLYDNNRTWRVVETCHNISFDANKSKRFHPDSYLFCTPHHLKTFANMPSSKAVIEFPIDPKQRNGMSNERKMVLNVGLWAPWKNQKEALEIARKYPHMDFHFLGNQAPNFKDYWEPLMQDVPKNVTIWGERDDVDEFMKKADVFMFNSTWECNPLVIREAISYGLPIVARNLPQYEDMFTAYLQPIDSNLNLVDVNYTVPIDNTSEVFGKEHVEAYEQVIKQPMFKQSPKKINITQYYVNNPFLEIRGESSSVFDVAFYDEQGVCHYSKQIGANEWVKLNREWYTKWTTKVLENGQLIYENTLNFENKRVYVAFDSQSLGDTIAWVPYMLEFKNKHNCHLIVSTFKNFLFKDVYPEIEFVQPGSVVNNITAMYKIGWFYDSNKEPVTPPNTIPLQQVATNILGLEYKEIKPRITFTPGENLYGRYVTIATNSTAGCKFWTKEGWQSVINHLIKNGYRVINVSKERNSFKDVMQIPEDLPMSEVMSIIHHSEFFIGLSSGLSWLAWALNKKVVMISNFTQDNHEFECIRITKTNVCHGCWNKADVLFDKGDWNWCPIHKGTDRQWECQNSITAEDVISCLPLSHS